MPVTSVKCNKVTGNFVTVCVWGRNVTGNKVTTCNFVSSKEARKVTSKIGVNQVTGDFVAGNGYLLLKSKCRRDLQLH